MSYHLQPIEKGVLGEPSKIKEEFEEFIDAVYQGNQILILNELSDMIGAIDYFLGKYHPTISIADLCKMARTTQRAFESGDRK